MKDDLPLSSDLLLRAYAMGIFPMAETRDSPDVFWVDPKHRGVLPLTGFHISRSLARRIRRDQVSATLNHNFRATVSACAAREDTWINDEIFELYGELHDLGRAHSLEVWANGKILGGVYGVTLGGAFFGESMFSSATDGSKMALAFLTTHLSRCGFCLFDTQFLTDHLASLGGYEMSRQAYHTALAHALEVRAAIGAHPVPSAQDVLQRRTHTS